MCQVNILNTLTDQHGSVSKDPALMNALGSIARLTSSATAWLTMRQRPASIVDLPYAIGKAAPGSRVGTRCLSMSVRGMGCEVRGPKQRVSRYSRAAQVEVGSYII